MLRLTTLIFLFISPALSIGQGTNSSLNKINTVDKPISWNATSVGIFYGGGGIIGLDYENLITKRLGVQMGVGLISIGGGINYHLKDGTESSLISFQYYRQGLGNSFVQDFIGPSFIYRSRKLFTCYLGLASIISRGPAYPSELGKTPIMLTYGIGLYLAH